MSSKSKSKTMGAFGNGRRTNHIKLVQIGYDPSPVMAAAKRKIKSMKGQGFRRK